MLTLDPVVTVLVDTPAVEDSSDAFSVGLILAAADSVTEDQRMKSYSAASELLSDGYTETDAVYLAAKAYFAADPAPSILRVSLYASSESVTDALDAAISASSTASFYGVFAYGLEETDTLTLAKYIETLATPLVLFCGVSAESVTPAEAVASGLLVSLYENALERTISLYGADEYAPAALMGAAMGLSEAQADSSFALCYKALPGTEAVSLTEAEITALTGINSNVYVLRGTNHLMVQQGATASGLRFDTMLYLDRIASELRSAAVALIADATVPLPQTDDTSAVFINRFSAILSEYTRRGILATGLWRRADVGSVSYGDVIENGYLMWADSYDDQSDADRAARKAMPINVALCLAGAVETLVIRVNVSI